jgi:hypothetical protein
MMVCFCGGRILIVVPVTMKTSTSTETTHQNVVMLVAKTDHPLQLVRKVVGLVGPVTQAEFAKGLAGMPGMIVVTLANQRAVEELYARVKRMRGLKRAGIRLAVFPARPCGRAHGRTRNVVYGS